MSKQPTSDSIPAIVIRSIAFGLLLMALFTMMWTGIAESGFAGRDHNATAYVFICFSIVFIGYGIYLFSIAKRFPKLTEEEKPEGKKMSKWYAIIFGSEGAAIGIVCGILAGLHLAEYIIPAIALIVGLHFYPMAKIFNRSIDYWLATWTCIVAITAIILVAKNITSSKNVFAFTGIGVAIATCGYGIYMLFAGMQYTKN